MARFIIALLIVLIKLTISYGTDLQTSTERPATVPTWAVAASCEIHVRQNRDGGGPGGSGTVCNLDDKAGVCHVITCRHVVANGAIFPITVKLSNGTEVPARFLGYHPDGFDLCILEIAAPGVPMWVPISQAPIYQRQGVVQVGYGVNATRLGKINQRTGNVTGYDTRSGKPGGNYVLSFELISGDSGSGIFDPDQKALVGVGWGGTMPGPRSGVDTPSFTGAKQCNEALEFACKRSGRQRGQGGGGCPGGVCPQPQPGQGGGLGKGPNVAPLPSQPGQPATNPGTVPPPLPAVPSVPAFDAAKALGGISDALAKQSTRLDAIDGKLDATGKALDGINTTLGKYDSRLTVLENRPDSTGPLIIKIDALANAQASMASDQTKQTAAVNEALAKLNAISSLKVQLTPSKAK